MGIWLKEKRSCRNIVHSLQWGFGNRWERRASQEVITATMSLAPKKDQVVLRAYWQGFVKQRKRKNLTCNKLVFVFWCIWFLWNPCPVLQFLKLIKAQVTRSRLAVSNRVGHEEAPMSQINPWFYEIIRIGWGVLLLQFQW